MNTIRQMCLFAVSLLLLIACTTRASEETIGVNGINSTGLLLPNGTPLTGNGIGIGQVEPHRPGDPSFDSMGTLFNTSVDPEEVFYARFSDPFNPTGTPPFNPTMNDPMGDETIEHPVLVAGVIISTDTQATGVATGAKLYSVGDNTAINQDAKALTSQFIATRNNGKVGGQGK